MELSLDQACNTPTPIPQRSEAVAFDMPLHPTQAAQATVSFMSRALLVATGSQHDGDDEHCMGCYATVRFVGLPGRNFFEFSLRDDASARFLSVLVMLASTKAPPPHPPPPPAAASTMTCRCHYANLVCPFLLAEGTSRFHTQAPMS